MQLWSYLKTLFSDWGDAPIDSAEYDWKIKLQEYYRARSNHSNDEESWPLSGNDLNFIFNFNS